MGFYKNSNATIKLFDSANLSGQRERVIREDLIAVGELRRFNFRDEHEVVLRCVAAEHDTCQDCWLLQRKDLIQPSCSEEFRRDHKSVIFERVEL